jgi:hypothetical protein
MGAVCFQFHFNPFDGLLKLRILKGHGNEIFTSYFLHELGPPGSLTRYLNAAFREAKHGFVLLCIKKSHRFPYFFSEGSQ